VPTILHTEASRGLGGQELRVVAESRWLLDHGWTVLVACQPQARLRAEAERAGVPAIPLAMRSAGDVAAILRLHRVLRRQAVDLVHTHSSVDAWVGGLAARLCGRPVVRSRHVSIRIRSGWVYRLADRVITSGETVRRMVIAAGVPAERVVSIPPGVDATRFHPGVRGDAVRAELGLGGPVVGLVANIRGSKGHNVFLEAVPRILAARPAARFLIVGDGVGYDEVRRRVAAGTLEGPVVMTGFRRDMPEVMAALDVLVLPSLRSEATSQVVPQALAVGTPVVATTVGGTPELIRDGETGRLVPPGDAAALARAVLDLLEDPPTARRLAAAGQALVRAHHTLDASMERTAAVYTGLLARRRAGTRVLTI
jgi:glycosyltransferase involved in cell wall biosynthesis